MIGLRAHRGTGETSVSSVDSSMSSESYHFLFVLCSSLFERLFRLLEFPSLLVVVRAHRDCEIISFDLCIRSCVAISVSLLGLSSQRGNIFGYSLSDL